MKLESHHFLLLVTTLIMVFSFNFRITAGVSSILYLLLNIRKNKVTLDYQPNKSNDEIIK